MAGLALWQRNFASSSVLFLEVWFLSKFLLLCTGSIWGFNKVFPLNSAWEFHLSDFSSGMAHGRPSIMAEKLCIFFSSLSGSLIFVKISFALHWQYLRLQQGFPFEFFGNFISPISVQVWHMAGLALWQRKLCIFFSSLFWKFDFCQNFFCSALAVFEASTRFSLEFFGNFISPISVQVWHMAGLALWQRNFASSSVLFLEVWFLSKFLLLCTGSILRLQQGFPLNSLGISSLRFQFRYGTWQA